MAALGIDKVTDAMVDDWVATLDALVDLADIEGERVSYLGFSMGTRFGLPFVARAGRRLRCAVLGKFGMTQPPSMPTAIDMASRFRRDAPTITVPLLFHVQWDDELFPRAGQFDLFELLGSPDKQLIAFAGPHGTATPAAVDAWCDFVTRHLWNEPSLEEE
jgi:dienelactone hydrolase